MRGSLEPLSDNLYVASISKMPDHFSDSDPHLATRAIEAMYCAEFEVGQKGQAPGEYGVAFFVVDSDNYGLFELDTTETDDPRLVLYIVKDGKRKELADYSDAIASSSMKDKTVYLVVKAGEGKISCLLGKSQLGSKKAMLPGSKLRFGIFLSGSDQSGVDAFKMLEVSKLSASGQ